MARQKAHGYDLRALVETAISRLKHRGSDRLTARGFEAQRKEIATRISAANRAIRQAKPVTLRIARAELGWPARVRSTIYAPVPCAGADALSPHI